MIGPICGQGRAVSELVEDARTALNHHDEGFASTCLLEHLHEQPDDVEAWEVLCRLLMDTDRGPFAYPIALCAVQKARNWRTLLMLGAIEANLQKPATNTLKAALKAMPKNQTEREKAVVYRLLANAYSQALNFKKAEYWGRKSLEIEDHSQAHIAIATSALHQRLWKEGWYHYKFQIGHHGMRPKHDYGAPEWEGQEGRILIYGDQGIGDQIAFMSAMPVRPAQINCVAKLKKLFQRAFPHSEVHGDWHLKRFDWALKSDYQASMATAMQWAEIKPRGRYLDPLPEKILQWRGLLNSRGSKPKIGIAWTGGSTGSAGWRDRSLRLQDLKPLLEMPFDWISLEYKDKSDEIGMFERETGIKIFDYSWGTQSADYEDTAALVDCLDAVVCVPTAVYHLAGALGKPALVLVHATPHWHEGFSGPCPWWETVEFYRRKDLGKDGAIQAVKKRLEELVNVEVHNELRPGGVENLRAAISRNMAGNPDHGLRRAGGEISSTSAHNI